MVKSGILCVASLGVASRITVTIAASDDAHGVFQFSPESLSVNGTEPEDGRSSVILQVSRMQSSNISGETQKEKLILLFALEIQDVNTVLRKDVVF